MTIPIPNLDNRTFEQLLEEARKSIQNYAPGWTNHNLADPGITFIELFAWLAEIIGYRINFVSEEHYLKYLKLLGIRPLGVFPAVTDLSFETHKTIPLKKGTVFLAEKTGEMIEFELLEKITVTPFELEKIIINEMSAVLSSSTLKSSQIQKLSRGIFDRSIANLKEDLFFAPFGLETRKGSEMYLGFRLKTANNEVEKKLNFMCYLYEKDLKEPGKHGEEIEYGFENAKLRWEISVSNEDEKWKEVCPEDRTKNFMKNGNFIFNDLKDWVTSLINIWSPMDKEEKYFWLRCTLMESEYEYPPRIQKILLNTAPVIQKKNVKGKILGESTGLSEQVFRLTETPILRGSLKLEVAGKTWEECEDFDSSGPESPNFVLEAHKGEIRFGDGIWGKVPQVGSEIKILGYETSRGEKGNLPQGSKWTIKEENIENLIINNFKPAIGGKAEESLKEAFERFNKDFKVPYRAITSDDFEYIARETPGLRIAQVKAIPNFDPYSKTERDEAVTVVLVPFSPLDTFEIPPQPSKGFREAVVRHLEKHRLIGTHIYVVSPEYVKVEIAVTLGISRGFFEEEVKDGIFRKLNIFLHPAKGGIQGNGWPVGKPVYFAEIHQLIMKSEGVNFVKEIVISAQRGAKTDENGDLILDSKIATVYSGVHLVEILESSE